VSQPPKVAVVVPAYNAAQFLAETLKCLTEQSYPNLEILVIDDGSKDRTAEIARSFPGVRVHSQSNSGLSAARNVGIAQTDSDFLYFLDADDLVPSHHLERLAAPLIDDPDVAASFCDTVWFEMREDGATETMGRSDRASYEADIQFQLIFSFVSMGAQMYRRSVIEKVGGFDINLRCCEDIDFNGKIARFGPWRFVTDTEFHYRKHLGSMSHNYERQYYTSISVIRRHVEFHGGQRLLKEERHHIGRARTAATSLIRQHLKNALREKRLGSEIGRACRFLLRNPGAIPYFLRLRSA
jgi:glycosyltransferase involved in cell wall biosynthesis